ncbi:MAG: GNAT family N-acetyltransferase [Verrucomicrobia bacterium]|nr:GNAT family N-acetyltransferase [Verrucomicrobiota bacterium]
MQILERLTLTIVAGLKEVLWFEPEWNALWQRVTNTTPFQSPGWLIACLRYLHSEPFQFILFRRGERLVAVLPLCVRSPERVPSHNEAEAAQPSLRLLGEGVSDYLDMLCLEEERSSVSELFQPWLADQLLHLQSAELQQLPRNGVLKSIRISPALHQEIQVGTPCPVVRLGERGIGAEWPIPEATKRHLETSLLSVKKIGRLRLEKADRASLDSAISVLFSLHARRWRRRGLPGVFETSEKQAFYREAFGALLRASALDLFTLFLRDVPIASLAAFRKDAVLYYYIGAFDPDYAKFSPGNLIILHVLEFARAAGCHTFDFLRGCEPYKYKWGAEDQPTYIRRIWRGGECGAGR